MRGSQFAGALGFCNFQYERIYLVFTCVQFFQTNLPLVSLQDYLCGDSSKAAAKLNWHPKTTINDLVKEMIAHDIELMRRNPTA